MAEQFDRELRRAETSMLRGGLSPKHARRMLAELESHYADTRDALVEQGYSKAEAEREAAARIGDLQAVAREALKRRELKSFVSLHPKTAFLLGPVLGYLVVALAFVLLVAGIVTLHPFPEEVEPSPAFIFLVRGLGWLYMYLLPLLFSALLLTAAISRRMPAGIVVAGLLLVALVGSFLKLSVQAPQAPGEQGSIIGLLSLLGYAPGFGFSPDFLGRDVFRIALTLLFSWAFWSWIVPRLGRAAAS